MDNCIAFSTDKGGDYVVALKENQPTLYAEMRELFEKSRTQYPDRFRTHETVEKNHGRFERRTCVQTDFVEWFAELDEWYGLRSVVAIMRHIAHQVLGRVKKAHHCGYVVAQNIPFGEAEPEGRPSVGVCHVV